MRELIKESIEEELKSKLVSYYKKRKTLSCEVQRRVRGCGHIKGEYKLVPTDVYFNERDTFVVRVRNEGGKVLTKNTKCSEMDIDEIFFDQSELIVETERQIQGVAIDYFKLYIDCLVLIEL